VTPTHSRITQDEAEFLVSLLIRRSRDLAAARLESANRLAAIRAALGAARDGEPDPLAYLRDQLAEEAGTAGNPRSGY
jgi:hypothetical protein